MDLSTKLEIVNQSDVGLKRPHNEDSTITDGRKGLVILADGMGGYKAGEIASALAVTDILHGITNKLKKLNKGIVDETTGFYKESLIVRETVIQANSAIFNTAKAVPQCQGMGTTVVVGLFHNNILSIAHVGDSRLYRLRNNELQQITKDHSLIQELIDRGLYTPEEAHANTPKNLVTRAMGIEVDVDVDLVEESVLPDDIYLLCSDGLNDMVKDEEIHLTLSKYSANLVQTADELVKFANKRGGKDNISIILIRVREDFSSAKSLVQKIKNCLNK
ncbi:MAG TPA: Stp1/IreP family PP2C-type Ser/Thr phosphatase [Thiotrichaceae bacterium]|jgi:protein phosphatase|nr:Stp1/IreP family PP2C-type Ser/Thr phosphatase [Thiotrichaceae bacterium]HIM07492.1 Stp1/IreP family PP2C-type Ser/Thr phosphatase [Gammaproteobacteria bacterium]